MVLIFILIKIALDLSKILKNLDEHRSTTILNINYEENAEINIGPIWDESIFGLFLNQVTITDFKHSCCVLFKANYKNFNETEIYELY